MDQAVLDYQARPRAPWQNFSESSSQRSRTTLTSEVNTVSPGPVSTALWLGEDGVAQTDRPPPPAGTRMPWRTRPAADAATGRFTTPEEVADLIVFLASGRAGNVTGADFTIDGGLIKTL